MGTIMVVQLYTHLSKEAKNKLRIYIQEQIMNGGPVILPPYTSYQIVPDDVWVEIQDLPGGQNHFLGGTYYNGKVSKKHGEV